MSQLSPGDIIRPLTLQSIHGEQIDVPSDKPVHLQFRRYAGCPYCHMHLASLKQRHDEVVAAGIQEVVLFHSTAEALLEVEEEPWPFAIVPDPDKELYRRFGVESSVRAAGPSGWGTAMRGLRAKPNTKMKLQGGVLGLPADFLIDPAGVVIAAKYGTRADDQWSVDELLGLVVDV